MEAQANRAGGAYRRLSYGAGDDVGRNVRVNDLLECVNEPFDLRRPLVDANVGGGDLLWCLMRRQDGTDGRQTLLGAAVLADMFIGQRFQEGPPRLAQRALFHKDLAK